MNKEAFLNYVRRPDRFELQDKLDIQAEKTSFPYCTLLQLFDLLSDKAAQVYDWETRFLPVVSIYVVDRLLLKEQLFSVKQIEILPTDRLYEKIHVVDKRKEKVPVDVSPIDVLEEINSYQEVSFKTAPKEVIIGHFLGSKSSFSQTDSPELVALEDIERKSLSTQQSFVTETLAVIYESQGEYKKAILAYEQLSLKYPEKKTIFADRIERIKALAPMDS